MSKNIFISYSRREVGFVNNLTDHLEKEQFNVWLDYRSLVPGKPWLDQIHEGIANSDVILLVISKASIASRNVELEWRNMLKEKDKRIILLVFEAVDLPKELEPFEWVDFRGNYKNALTELNRQLQAPEQEEHPAPETGFKIPAVVWLAFVLSIPAAILSLTSAWTLLVPFFLAPLPYRILKRNFNYLPVQASLLMLPFAIFLTANFTVDDELHYILQYLAYTSLPFVLWLMYLLRSEGIQRWGKPEAVAPASARKGSVEYPPLKPVSFFIDHAPEDQKIADHIRAAFKETGHPEAADSSSAKAVFPLISRFKGDSAADWEKQVVYPVIIQSNDNISKQLSRLQWLDLRSGVRKMDVVAKMLPAPERLLRSLGIRPMGNQLILPSVIMYLTYFLIFLGVVCIGSWIPYYIQYLDDLLNDSGFITVFVQLTLSLILFGTLTYFMVRNLIERKGPFASLIGLLLGVLVLGGIILWQIEVDNLVFDLLNTTTEELGVSSLYPYAIYTKTTPLMLIYLWFNRKNLMYWFPAKK